ncbi:sphingosine kinase 1 [Nematostella vectensis]|uniref:sphingosine kinase 1 n=1 Tax=Nematostella vectensis TaxID=45351 RepID=UPI001390612D|nr:sphingosine kinase 1 [Nematostella vectensis]
MANAVILQNCFQIFPKKAFYEVRLTRDSLIYEETSFRGCCQGSTQKHSVIKLRDVYGVKLFKSREPADDSAYFHVFSCPLRKDRRECEKLPFKVSGWENSIANVKLAEKWVRTISWLVKCPSMDLESIQAKKNLPPSRKMLVFVNPFSGKGKSLKIFRNKVAPMFENADIDYKLVITEYAGHAKAYASQLCIPEWDGVVICSGDGLVFEVLNGFMNRQDWEVAIKMPIGVIPTGSGNALCFSSLHASGEPMEVVCAIYAVIRGNIHEMDIASIVTPTSRFYSFLSMTWGIMSDVDIESEKYRYLGNARFTVGAVVRILNLRLYQGRISYLPYEEDGQFTRSSGFDMPDLKPAPSDGILFQSPRDADAESFKSPSGSFYSMPGSPTEERLPGMMGSGCVNPGIDREQPSVNSIAENIFQEPENSGNLVSTSNKNAELVVPGNQFGPELNLLPALEENLPSSWKSVEGKFILCSSVMMSHLGPDICAAPQSKFGDGILYVAYAEAGISKMQLLDMFMKMEDGSHIDCEEIVCVRACAFRLEPDLTQLGTIAIDGELIPYSAVQGQVHRGLGRVMCV